MKPMQYGSRSVLFFVAGWLMFGQTADAQKSAYVTEIIKAAQKTRDAMPGLIAEWKKNPNHSVLWGYNPPAEPIYLAATYGHLYAITHDEAYAERALRLLADYGSLRETLPSGFAASRAEYAHGVPAFTNFFFIAPFAEAYLSVRDSRTATPAVRAGIEKDLADCIDFVYTFPEWGTHNRAMLRAYGFLLGVRALPQHPHARQWKRMAEAIAADNLHAWEVEDATVYHPIWLHTLLRYAEDAGESQVHMSPLVHYYDEYFTHLMTPAGLVADFGDAYWESSIDGLRFVAILERGAALFHDPTMRWAAATLFATERARNDTTSIVSAYHLCDAYRWADESLAPVKPSWGSEEVLEDLVGKKIVFRNGWDPGSTYLLLNYRDEGDGGWMSRFYLRNTLTVEEEKMHHGHADENSISMLMHHGSVLLHDAGYRGGLPSGPFGAWRQDYFHNRVVVRENKRDTRQGVLEFIRNSGAYRPVQTSKIDFVRLRDAEMSRTRLTEGSPGYAWDRIIAYVKRFGVFVVIDLVKATRADYLTITNLWHGEHLQRLRDGVYRIETDSIRTYALPRTAALNVQFLKRAGKTEGTEPIERHGQSETALYQTIASQYKAGDVECFVTVLTPFDRTEPDGNLPRASLVETSTPDRAVGVRLEYRGTSLLIGAKLDLESELATANIRPRYQYDLGKATYGNFETDAHFFVADESGLVPSFSAVNVLKVYYHGREVMSALPSTYALQPDGGPDRISISKWRVYESEP